MLCRQTVRWRGGTPPLLVQVDRLIYELKLSPMDIHLWLKRNRGWNCVGWVCSFLLRS